MKLPLEGGCLCGAVRYRIGGRARSVDYCHCRMCRRAAGAPVVVRLTVAAAAFAWIEGKPAVYRSSAEAERLFCPNCGTQLALRDEPDYLDVTLASLDDPAAVDRAITSGPPAGSPGSTRRTTSRATRGIAGRCPAEGRHRDRPTA